MRDKIICRFKNENDLFNFCKINNVELEKNTKYYNFITAEHKIKKDIKIKSLKKDWTQYDINWVGLPEFISEKQYVYAKIEFSFGNDIELAKKILNQNITDKTTSVWYPKLIQGQHSKCRVVGGIDYSKYPIYVVSKGRAKNCTTSEYLTRMQQYHYVVVEPNEVEEYKVNLQNKYCRILELDMRYKENYDTFDNLGDSKSKGPGGARNFCWEHSMKKGFKWHWVMDDNANEGFFWLNNNRKIKCRTATMFRACEDFVDRYDNIAIAGLNYSKFCKESDKVPPYVVNTRIYSFLLIRNDIPYRWRGRYNEDTDLSLRVLKDGWCTVQFNTFLAGKATTQKIKGGNTEEFYSKEGTYPKSKMLEDMHPDVAKVVWKFNRWHHQVDYSSFIQKLHPVVNLNQFKKIDNYGMCIINTIEEDTNDNKEYLTNKYKNLILTNGGKIL